MIKYRKTEELMDIINTRRSIRKYTEKPVEDELLIKMLEAAMNAPTARNLQEWKFVVIKDRSVLKQIADALRSAKMTEHAGAAVVVLGDKTIQPKDEYIYVDCGAAIENLLLEAHSLGLGCCWCAIGPNEDRIEPIREILGLEEHLVPVANIAIGWPDEEKEANHRYDEKKVTWIK